MCLLFAGAGNGRIVKIQSDPDHPFTAGFACGDAPSVTLTQVSIHLFPTTPVR